MLFCYLICCRDNITVHYSGWVDESSPVGDAGEMFDSSRIKDVPFSFQIGAGDVIGGWDQGLLGMCIGEKRRLTIPPSLGYGSDGIGIIPGGAVLRFEVECIDIKDPVPLPPQNIFLEMDIDLSNTLTVEEFTQWFYDNAYPNADESHHYFLFEDKNRVKFFCCNEFQCCGIILNSIVS